MPISEIARFKKRSSRRGGRRRLPERVSQVVGGDVNGLHAGDGPLGRRRDALLQTAHFRSEGGLVTDGARNTTEKGRHFGAGLGKAEDVIDEEQHVLPVDVAKVSATVSAESATRARAPGGSFICPKTSAVFERTLAPVSSLDSAISKKRSFPSRVRSPTPANTDTPPNALATLLISSWMSTVLPTPAPPKRPIFPPRR